MCESYVAAEICVVLAQALVQEEGRGGQPAPDLHVGTAL